MEGTGRVKLIGLLAWFAGMTMAGAGAAQEPLKIGAINPYSGPLALYGDEMARGYQIAVNQRNAKGGVRTTYLDVPLFTYTIPNSGPGLCNQTGYQTRLPDEVLDKLYKNYGQYVSKVEHRLKELMDEGWFPKEYASDYVQRDLKDYKQ